MKNIVYMPDREKLISNISKIHTTEMGIVRIKKNLNLDIDDVVDYCKMKILDKNCKIQVNGKNYYCEIDDLVITVSLYSYTIITAHFKK